jgi:hypothetical protein
MAATAVTAVLIPWKVPSVRRAAPGPVPELDVLAAIYGPSVARAATAVPGHSVSMPATAARAVSAAATHF